MRRSNYVRTLAEEIHAALQRAGERLRAPRPIAPLAQMPPAYREHVEKAAQDLVGIGILALGQWK